MKKMCINFRLGVFENQCRNVPKLHEIRGYPDLESLKLRNESHDISFILVLTKW